MNRKQPSLRIETMFLLVSVLCVAAACLVSGHARDFPIHAYADEMDILKPAVDHIRGAPYSQGKYPLFPIMFHELFIRLASAHEVPDPAFLVRFARFVNIVLFAMNVGLFYCVARFYLDRGWSLLAGALYVFSPAVFYSGVLAKTESLLLAEIFLCLIAVHRIQETPDRVRWHILAAAMCALALTTKYTFMLLSMYVCVLFTSGILKTGKTVPERVRGLLGNRNVWAFAGVYLLTVLATWPTIWQIREVVQHAAGDLYLLPYPSVLRAVAEPFAFPYGRYSYSLTTLLPLAAGWANYLLAWLAILLGLVPRRLLIFYGIFSLLYLLIIQSVTLLRPPYMFTPIVPFLILSAALFLRHLFTIAPLRLSRVVGVLLILIAAGFSVVQYPSVSMSLAQNIVAIERASKDAGYRLLLLVHSEFTELGGVDHRDIAGSVDRIAPEYILVLDSYFSNFGKYRNPEYRRQYEYFRDLVDGRTEYQIAWRFSVDIPFRRLFFDPELSAEYVFFRRSGRVPYPGN